jgi:hypothetical protein
MMRGLCTSNVRAPVRRRFETEGGLNLIWRVPEIVVDSNCTVPYCRYHTDISYDIPPPVFSLRTSDAVQLIDCMLRGRRGHTVRLGHVKGLYQANLISFRSNTAG